MAKILITGASGFVGSFLIEEALKREMQVFAGIRQTSSRAYLQDPKIKFVHLDFSNPSSYAQELATHQFDFVIHNAGLTKAKNPKDLFTVNSDFTRSFAQTCQEQLLHMKSFVFISSIASYGPADNSESDLIRSEGQAHPITDYGRSKLQAEKQLKAMLEFPWAIVRPTAVFGPREKDIFALFKAVNMGLAPKIGFQNQKLSFIYVKDLARLIIDAAVSGKNQFEFFASDTRLYSASELSKTIANSLRKKTIPLTIPIPMLRAIAFMNESFGKLTGSYPALNYEKVNELASRSWACDSDTIQKDFNFAPAYTLAEAIDETVAWYKAENWL